ncbi:MAG: hypothetical protein KGN79_06515 [Acidobacteriota bacterium]|nr:hypothetical protein [Acidobacteriota bacterium]
MILLTATSIKIASSLVAIVAIGLTLWLVRRHRPTLDELERMRRSTLARTGRLVDGMVLDICEMEGADGTTRTMLIYNYRIGGVDYECSQDITTIASAISPSLLRAGFPCSVRYKQGFPQDSIVLAEEWSGLRSVSGKFQALRDPA